jgi:ribosome biogenesis protein ERB1
MGSKLVEKKRKSRIAEPESEDEFDGGDFDGILSQSEDDFDVGSDEGHDEDEDESESEGSQSGDNDGDSAILSDDIPSDVDGEDAIGKILEEQPELEIEEPGVDPKRKEEDDAGRNYRIEKDANGNERYVYEFVCLSREIYGSRR